MRKTIVYLFLSCLLYSANTFAINNCLTEGQIKELLIDQSIEAYPGNCPCPYHKDSIGRKCGARSAWSRPGGYSPLCCTSDITEEMIEEYREKNGCRE